MAAKRIASPWERKLTVTDDDEATQAGAKQSAAAGGGREAGQPPDEHGIVHRREFLNEPAFAGGVTAAGETDGPFDYRESVAVTRPAGRTHHRIEPLEQRPRGRIAPAPPGCRFVLPEQVPDGGGQAVKCRAAFRAQDAQRRVALQGSPSQYRRGFGLTAPGSTSAAPEQ